MKASTGVGFAVVLAHAVGFVALAARCHGTELAIDTSAADPVPAALADRVTIADDAPPGPGLHHQRWSVMYRGGFERAVGAAEMRGPFQDPAAATCTGRIVVGQKLLDQIAVEMKKQIEAEMAGEGIVGIGDFERVRDMSLRWAKLETHYEDIAAVGEAPDGYVRAAVRLGFSRIDVPVVIALVPNRASKELTFRMVTYAQLAFGNTALQWVSDKLGGDKLATRLVRRQIDGLLVTALAPPPPFELPGGETLRFTYCGEPAQIFENVSGALPFAVEIHKNGKNILPPKRGKAKRAIIANDATVALDLDLDALNAIMYELWRTGFLDKQLAQAGLDKAFNEHPVVQELLTIRMSPVTLAQPPTLAPANGKLRMSADARVTITDATSKTTGRIWGGLDFAFAPSGVAPAAVDLGALELSCERTAVILVPCYAELVDTIRGNGAEFHGALTQAFAKILDDLFVERHLGASELPAELVIDKAVPQVTQAGQNASLHLDLYGALHSTP